MSAGKKGKLMCERSHNDCLMVQSFSGMENTTKCLFGYSENTYTHTHAIMEGVLVFYFGGEMKVL